MKTNQSYIAKTFAGLEEVLAEEIKKLGGINIKTVNRAVIFKGDKALLYKTNYLCRTAIRVLVPISTFRAENENELYKQILKIKWEDYIHLNGTFSIDGITSYSNITHSKYLALKTKDAVADRFREKYGRRPNVDTKDPDVKINVRVFRNECTVSLDSSVESLHKRGYRIGTGPAPLNEVLAAGMIQLSGWDGKSNFIDPMCGSGTLPIEAAMFAGNIPAGKFREQFGFTRWKDFDKELWQKVRDDAEAAQKEYKHQIIGSDRSGRILNVARENVASAGLENVISLKARYIDDVEPPAGGGVMITNPPYGERIKVEDIKKLYSEIGDALKTNFEGYSAWIISSDKEALKFIGLRPSRKITLFNGPLESGFYKFEIYKGTKRVHKKKRKRIEKGSNN
jgi:putative N6-adenine-specific DNA methylase